MANGNGNGAPDSTGLNDALQRVVAAYAMKFGGNVPPGVFAGNPPGTPGIQPSLQALGTGTQQDPFRQPGVDPRNYLTPRESYTAPPGTPSSPAWAPNYGGGGAGVDPSTGQYVGGAQAASPYAPGQPGQLPASAFPQAAPAAPPSAQPQVYGPPFQGQWPGGLQPSTGSSSGHRPIQFEQTAPGQFQLAPGQLGPSQQLGPGAPQMLPGQGGLPGSRWDAQGGVPYRYNRRGSDYRVQGYPGGAPAGGNIPLSALEKAYRQQQGLLSQGIKPSGVIYGQSPVEAARGQVAGGQAAGGPGPGQPAAPLTGANILPPMPTIEQAYALAGKLSQPFYETKREKETRYETDQFGNRYPFEVTRDRNVPKPVDPHQIYQQMVQGWQAQTNAIIAQQQATAQLQQGQTKRDIEERKLQVDADYKKSMAAAATGRWQEAMKNRQFREQQDKADRLLKKMETWQHETQARQNDMKTQLMLSGNNPDNLPHPQTEAEARALGPGALFVGLDGKVHVNEGKWMGGSAITPGGGLAPDEGESLTQ